ncbi:DUF4974 domain-containing protein [Puteibacter caeruleilacunae]|nr:DUF4974 domain-containing protein [Puteibacter caeruleilacunae]
MSHLNNKIEQLIKTRRELSDEARIDMAAQQIQRVKQIDTDQAFDRVLRKTRERKPVYRIMRNLQRVAAILFIPLLIASISYVVMDGDSKEELAWQTISNPHGIRSQLTLPDGSDMWINAGTTVKYPIPFKGNRMVDVTGEIFLHVKKQNGEPFHVMADDVRVEVLGTQFNVRAYEEDANIEVALLEGSVSLKNTGYERAGTYKIDPGTKAVLNTKTNKWRFLEEDVAKYASWHQGRLYIEDERLEDAVVLLSRWFGVDVMIEDEMVKDMNITTVFEDQSVSQVMELLELGYPIETQYIPGKYNTKDKPKVIIRKK